MQEFEFVQHAQLEKEEGPKSLIRKHYPAFDGLRGLAIFFVFVNHYGSLFLPAPIAASLWFGVDLFFALSGFLITGILYDSKDRPHFFRTFYVRRVLRIFPLFYGFFLLVFLLTPALHLHYAPSLWCYLVYLGNFKMLFHGDPAHIFVGRIHNTLVDLGALWSLCVEEQFYLVWPLVLWLLPSRRAMMRFCTASILVTLCLRTALFLHNPSEALRTHSLYNLTFTRCDTLLMGCWLALWLRGVRLNPARVKSIGYTLMLASSSILVAGAVTIGRRWPYNEGNPLLSTYGYTLVGLFSSGVLLLALDETSAVYRVLKNRFLASLGVISYGFYFFHGLPVRAVATINDVALRGRFFGLLLSVAAFAGIYLLAWLSFRFFESPFLRLKSRLAPPEPVSQRQLPAGPHSRIA